jgi:hypothetical protein
VKQKIKEKRKQIENNVMVDLSFAIINNDHSNKPPKDKIAE